MERQGQARVTPYPGLTLPGRAGQGSSSLWAVRPWASSSISLLWNPLESCLPLPPRKYAGWSALGSSSGPENEKKALLTAERPGDTWNPPSGGGLVLSQAGHTESRLEALSTDPNSHTQLLRMSAWVGASPHLSSLIRLPAAEGVHPPHCLPLQQESLPSLDSAIEYLGLGVSEQAQRGLSPKQIWTKSTFSTFLSSKDLRSSTHFSLVRGTLQASPGLCSIQDESQQGSRVYHDQRQRFLSGHQ